MAQLAKHQHMLGLPVFLSYTGSFDLQTLLTLLHTLLHSLQARGALSGPSSRCKPDKPWKLHTCVQVHSDPLVL